MILTEMVFLWNTNVKKNHPNREKVRLFLRPLSRAISSVSVSLFFMGMRYAIVHFFILLLSFFPAPLFSYEETGTVVLIQEESGFYYEGDILDENRVIDGKSYYEFLELGERESILLDPAKYRIVRRSVFDSGREKNRFLAPLRSMALPGWGSYYGQGSVWKSAAFGGAFALLATASYYEKRDYKREKEMRDEIPFTYPIFIPLRQNHDAAARRHYKDMQFFGSLAAVVYVASLVDAWFGFEDYSSLQKGRAESDFVPTSPQADQEPVFQGFDLGLDASRNIRFGLSVRF